MTRNEIETRETRPGQGWWTGLTSPWPAVAGIWGTSTALAIWAPDMISGSQHEHLPLAMMTVWLWSAAASAFALLTPRRSSLGGWSAAVVIVWTATLLTGVFAPVMVTGSDPTRIPLAVLVLPPVAAVVTGLLSLNEASRQLDEWGRFEDVGRTADRASGPDAPRETTPGSSHGRHHG